MPLNSAHASTQDNTGGTPVAITTNEDASSGNIQIVSLVGNKTIYAETGRTAITVADSTADLSLSGFGSAGLIEVANFLTAAVRATCTVASATLSGRLVIYDGSSNVLGYTESMTFAADATFRLTSTGDYVSQRILLDLGQARKVKFLATAVSAGSWSVYVRPI